jgi:uncharacterized protein
MLIEKFGSVRVILSERVEARTFMTGFHGVGQVGWIATRYIVDSIGARRVGFVISPYMQPFVTVREGVIAPYELYSKDEFLFFVANVPLSQKDMSLVSLALAEEVVRLGVECSILFGGLDKRFASEEGELLRVAPTSSFRAKYGHKMEKLKVIEEGLGIVGPLAYMLAFYEAHEHPALAILPYAAADRPDPLAASRAVEVAGQLVGLRVDVSRLVEEAELLERRYEELEKKISELMREREPPAYHV